MRLSYCGLPFDYEPPALDKAETQLNQQYQKRLPNFAYPRHIPVVQPTQDLQRRGISYHTQASRPVHHQISIAPPQPSAQSPGLRVGSWQRQKQQLLRDIAERHKANIQQRLQHRLSVARAIGNENLIAQLEREMHQTA